MSLASIIFFLSTPGSVVASGALGAAVSGWTLWTRSRRTERQTFLSTRGTTLEVSEDSSAGNVTAFVDRLAELALRDWLELGADIAAVSAQSAAWDDAWHGLQLAVSDHGLQLAAWYVRDAVQTAAFLASRRARRCSRRDGLVFSAARRAAESAALAIIARPYLDPEDFSLLQKPVAHLVARASAGPDQRIVARGRSA
jgi:hypothetical protein